VKRVRILAVVENVNQSELEDIGRSTAGSGTKLQSDLGFVDDIPKGPSGRRLCTRSLVEGRGIATARSLRLSNLNNRSWMSAESRLRHLIC
jgi:hypothetical protein